MEDATIENTRIFSYRVLEEVPDKIEKALIEVAKENSLDQLFQVSAVRNKSGTYIGKGFIYTSEKNFVFFKDVIDGKSLDPENVFFFEDEDGFPVTFEVSIANVYEFGKGCTQNKLFCKSVPSFVTTTELEKIFKKFTTKHQIITAKGDTLFFPRVVFKKTSYGQTVTVSFEDTTPDAYYAFIMTRRLDFKSENGRDVSMIFSPCEQHNNAPRHTPGRGRGRGQRW